MPRAYANSIFYLILVVLVFLIFKFLSPEDGRIALAILFVGSWISRIHFE